MENQDQLVEAVVAGIQEVKGKNISKLDFTKFEYTEWGHFVISDAESTTQVASIANSIIRVVQETTGEKPFYKEGYTNGQWILLDYSNVVVHIFQTPYREFYKLEDLWADAERTDIPDID